MALLYAALLSVILFVIASVVAILVHEIAHLLAAWALNVRVKRVGVTWRGPYLVREQGPPLSNAYIALAGPFANLVLGILFFQTAPTFAQINLVLGFSNLLPIQGSDGLHAWTALRAVRVLVQPAPGERLPR